MNTITPLVSIIMLTYNRAPLIAKAIGSVLAQTYQNWELIILDDGSTDDTAAVVAGFSDKRIFYHRDTVNKGLYARRRESLTHATGEYVAILDSDDYWTDTEKLTAQVAHLERNPAGVVVGTFITLIDGQDTVVGKNSYYTDDATIRRTMLWRNQFANSSVLMRRSALLKTAGYQNFAPCEDYELFLQLGYHGTFANLPSYSLAYRVHGGGESARKAKVARQSLRVIARHRAHYPGYFAATAKLGLLYLLATLHLK
jgi:glycosyltransferase involved in cell wall biosynthesis